MARVVTRRSGPPYLLIVFAFLFVVATALAVIFHLEADKLAKQDEEKAKLLEKLATSEERARGGVAKMIDLAESTARSGRTKSVVSQLNDRIGELTQIITGQVTEHKAAVEAVEAARKRGSIGLAGLLNEAERYRGDWRASEGKLVEEKARWAEEEADLQAQIKDAIAEADRFKGELAKREQELTALRDQMKTETAAYEERLGKAEAQWKNDIDEARKNVAGLHQTINDLNQEIQRLNSRNRKLQEVVKERTGPRSDPMIVARRLDGRVIKVLEEEGICYVDIGEKDRITPGLTFSVYPAEGIPESGEGKGSLIVTNVDANTSECRIVTQVQGDPIVAGDGVANVVFDTLRTHTFVVEGEFDLYGRGKPSEAGTREVKSLIRQFGGNVVEEIDINTDFVVIGEEPAKPPQPAESAPPTVWAVYKAQMRLWQRYQDVKDMAQRLQLPVMNTTRFLALVGYQPAMQQKILQ